MNVQRLQALRRAQQYHLLPIKVGMMVELHEKIGEWNNQRIWRFKWLVIKVKKPNHADGTFTIRWKTSGLTIEKIYPLSFPNFEHVYLLDVYKVAKAKLYYMRDKIGKDAKLKSLITAEQRGFDLLQQAKENLAAEIPALAEVLDSKEEVTITEETADEIIASSEEVAVEETVTEEVAVVETEEEVAPVEEVTEQVAENNRDETENASA